MNYPPRETLLADGSGTTVQTWISLTAVAVSLITAISASYWNFRALNAAEKRYNRDREDKFTETIGTAIVDVIHQSLIWEPVLRSYTNALAAALHGRQNSLPKAFMDKAAQRVEKEASEFEAKTSDMKRALIAAKLVVSDEKAVKLLNSILAAVDEAEGRFDDYHFQDTDEKKGSDMADIMLFQYPAADYVLELTKRAEEITRARLTG